MQERVAPDPSDADLVARARAGDRASFAAIYDRYSDRLHDFCWSLLRNRDDAADATQDTFLRAVERLDQLKDPAKVRSWLYSIARHEALARLKSRKRQVPDEGVPDMPDLAAGPDTAASQNELRDLVWDAAAGLADRDRMLLDLHVRQGLEGAELAEAAGVRADHAYVLLNRLRHQVERSMGALLVARLGRDECGELTAILAGWDGRFSVLVRKRVARHVDNCDICGERRRTAASPMALLSAVPVMLAPPELRDVVLAAFTRHAGASEDGSDGPSGGSPRLPRPSRTAMLISGSAALVVAGVVAGIMFFGPGDNANAPTAATTDAPATAGTSTTATTPPSATASPLDTATDPPSPDPADTGGQAVDGPSATEDEASREDEEQLEDEASTTEDEESTEALEDPTPTEPPQVTAGELVVTTTTLDLGADLVDGVVQLRNAGGSPLMYQVASSAPWLAFDHDSGELAADTGRDLRVSADRSDLAEGDHRATVQVTSADGTASIDVLVAVERPPVVDGLSVDPGVLGLSACPPDSALASADVTDESGVASAEMSWQGPDGAGTTAMTLRSGSWYARLGPFESPGQVVWHLVAVDTRGNTSTSEPRTLTVNPCPQ
ncbi:sigma-70 family RNA polymerase sigma factor [Phytoactinopolyspora endophytica]|uniref:sigma-70 family RNA polymerase sigma factor n=1 Tax=Phytoactinopolyspora endophytica TaxID=1642495 RepID=UPI00101D7D72|nr:sigma-70 family RNA polymerase sigma factor [Phytoactinopolyspora endophytica]